MRLGSYSCRLVQGTKVSRIYQSSSITERHRHRFEFNNEYTEVFEKTGMRVAGTSPDQVLTEIVELTDHPFYVGCQFHPEFISRPERPHPLFEALITAGGKTHVGRKRSS